MKDMKTTEAEKRVRKALTENEGSYVEIGFGSHRVTSDKFKLIVRFNEITLQKLFIGKRLQGQYPKFYLADN